MLAPAELRARLAAQARRGRVHPVYLGSARTGAGVGALMAGLTELLPAAAGDPAAPAAGTVFKIERGAAGEKIAYVRMRAGTVRARERLRTGTAAAPEKVTALEVFEAGTATARDAVAAGQIGRLWGLQAARIGDAIGDAPADHGRWFAPPTLETVVVPGRGADRRALRVALEQLAEQDPLIAVRQDTVRGELSVSLYGEMQKEVIQATLADDFGVAVSFRPTTTLCLERPAGGGAAAERMDDDANPFLATVGLRVEPAPRGAGVTFGLAVELGSMPPAFFTAVEETVHRTLSQGLRGWPVTDCAVTMTDAGYAARQSHSHATFDKSMSSTAGDFRGLTPLVLMAALRAAGTTVLEPVHRFRLELPADTAGPVLPVLARYGAVPEPPVVARATCTIAGTVPAAQVHALRGRLPALTRGEALLESAFDHHAPVTGPPPARPRTDDGPLDREAYLRAVTRPRRQP